MLAYEEEEENLKEKFIELGDVPDEMEDPDQSNSMSRSISMMDHKIKHFTLKDKLLFSKFNNVLTEYQ